MGKAGGTGRACSKRGHESAGGEGSTDEQRQKGEDSKASPPRTPIPPPPHARRGALESEGSKRGPRGVKQHISTSVRAATWKQSTGSPRGTGPPGDSSAPRGCGPALRHSRARADRKLLAPEYAATKRDRNMGGQGPQSLSRAANTCWASEETRS